MPTLSSGNGGNTIPKIKVKSATKDGFEIAGEGDSINFAVLNSKTRRGRVGNGVAQTLDSESKQAVVIAQRGRGESGNTEQQLEQRYDGNTNTLTGVQKDNLIIQKTGGYCTTFKEDTTGTLQSGGSNVMDKVPNVFEHGSIRRLTEIECERLQGLPDNWTMYGNWPNKKLKKAKDDSRKNVSGQDLFNELSNEEKINHFKETSVKKIPQTQRYKLVGNAVTKDIVELIGRKLLKTML